MQKEHSELLMQNEHSESAENFYNLEKEYQEKILNSLINSLTDSEPELLISILFKAKAFEKIMKDFDRDHWMNAQEALEYGIVDGFANSF